MSERHILLKTNMLVCIIIAAGFMITALLSYKTNYKAAIEGVEQVSALTSEGIVSQISTIFAKPVNMSLTMGDDHLLAKYLEDEKEHLEDEQYTEMIKKYLAVYRDEYGYDSVFLASAVTNRYYNFNGVDRILTRDNSENHWFYSLLDSGQKYALRVDNDEVANAGNAITVFVNCRITGDDGQTLGIVGVGLKVDELQNMLRTYKESSGVEAALIDDDGIIQVSPEYNGYQNVSYFKDESRLKVRDKILGIKEGGKVEEIWIAGNSGSGSEDYIITCYIPELSWHLVVEHNMGEEASRLRNQVLLAVAVIIILLLIVLVVITYVIRNFNKRLMNLTKDQEESFRKATEQLYDNIYEINVTENYAAGASTERYFKSLGVPPNMSFDKALTVIADKQIKEEFREGYINTFSPENVLNEFTGGNNHLQYDFMISEDGMHYYWMRIDAYIYKSAEDGRIHMFVYRKNIDEEKRNELRTNRRIQMDEMTGLYTKTATQQHISQILDADADSTHAFFIFDIDDFKQANDQYGHMFGDYVIVQYASVLKKHFRKTDILGRIGGDEFAAFITVPDLQSVVEKAEELSKALDYTCVHEGHSFQITTSIGVASAPVDGKEFETLYKKADKALYQTKESGKNGFTIYGRRQTDC